MAYRSARLTECYAPDAEWLNRFRAEPGSLLKAANEWGSAAMLCDRQFEAGCLWETPPGFSSLTDLLVLWCDSENVGIDPHPLVAADHWLSQQCLSPEMELGRVLALHELQRLRTMFFRAHTVVHRIAVLARSRLAGDEPAETRDDAATADPRVLLTGWHDICAALDMTYDRRKDVGSLSSRFGGPITNDGPGTRPMVYRDALIEWWNKLAITEAELANRRKGERLSAESQHAYGRTGTAAPEIGGGIKDRRRRPTET